MPCQNGGTCRDLIGRYKCDCLIGYEGIHCEVNIDNCSEEKCKNGGVCQDLVDDFICVCPLGTEGRFCEVLIHIRITKLTIYINI